VQVSTDSLREAQTSPFSKTAGRAHVNVRTDLGDGDDRRVVTSTIFTLRALPAFYLLVHRIGTHRPREFRIPRPIGTSKRSVVEALSVRIRSYCIIGCLMGSVLSIPVHGQAPADEHTKHHMAPGAT